jgi:hypothetical protein
MRILKIRVGYGVTIGNSCYDSCHEH